MGSVVSNVYCYTVKGQAEKTALYLSSTMSGGLCCHSGLASGCDKWIGLIMLAFLF
jgi:hypothetical protein